MTARRTARTAADRLPGLTVAETKTLKALLVKVDEPAKTAAKTPAKKTAAPAKKAAARKPRKTAAQKAREAKSAEFVGWLKETAEARKARQASNSEMAKWMRSKGILPNGPAWDAAKKGERSVAKLRKLNADAGIKPVTKK